MVFLGRSGLRALRSAQSVRQHYWVGAEPVGHVTYGCVSCVRIRLVEPAQSVSWWEFLRKSNRPTWKRLDIADVAPIRNRNRAYG